MCVHNVFKLAPTWARFCGLVIVLCLKHPVVWIGYSSIHLKLCACVHLCVFKTSLSADREPIKEKALPFVKLIKWRFGLFCGCVMCSSMFMMWCVFVCLV